VACCWANILYNIAFVPCQWLRVFAGIWLLCHAVKIQFRAELMVSDIPQKHILSFSDTDDERVENAS